MSMSGFWKVFEGLKGLYNGINPATLTGAIDVVIIQNADGTFSSSPFHVRFGKLGVLRSREKVVDIEINGEPSDLQMKLGEAGEAFFVQEVETDEEQEFPAHLATSPLPDAMNAMELMSQGVAQLHHFTDDDPKPDVIEVLPESILTPSEMKSDSSYEGAKSSERPRRKVLKKKKKRHNGGSPRSVSMPENVSGQEAMFEMEVTSNSSEDEEVSMHMFGDLRSASSPQIKDMVELSGTTSHRRMSSIGNGSMLTPFSDPETSPITSPMGSRPATPKSDTEVDKQHTEQNQTSVLLEHSATWAWGEFPVSPEEVTRQTTEATHVAVTSVQGDKEDSQGSKGFMSILGGSRQMGNKKMSVVSEAGMYLDQLMEDPEMMEIYLTGPRTEDKEDDCESGRGQSLPQSPNSVEGSIGGPAASATYTQSEVRHLGPVSLSLCGGLTDSEGVTLNRFMQSVITFEDLANEPNIINNPDLVVKIQDKFYNWTTAGPMVLSQIVFHKQLPEPSVKELEKDHMPKKIDKKKGKRSWFSWVRSTEVEEIGAGGERVAETISASSSTVTLTEGSYQCKDSATSTPADTPQSSASNTPRKHRPRHSRPLPGDNTSTETDTDASEKEVSKSTTPPQILKSTPPRLSKCTPPPPLTVDTDLSEQTSEIGRQYPPLTSPLLSPPPLDTRHAGGVKKRTKFIKNLRLSTDQVIKANLRPGHNELVFSVTTQYQGTTRCVSHVYLWHHTDKIVISDIDGTITKSDVIGQIMPILGRDWSQSGVADLFTRINKNGYKMIYLSARAIGQARSTKDMLKSIKQGNLVLPDGPMFLNPTSLFSAFHREVIVKNPEEFKISCLKDIGELFPSSPFYAGFGNKFNDVIAYRALSIPNSHIFTVNPQGQLRHDLSLTFISSYSGMSDIVDHFFPSLDQVDLDTSQEYNPVNYWRDPIPRLSDDELILVSTTPTAQQSEKEK